MESKIETAAFAAGCFWGVEEAFSKVPGVTETEVGYAGGHTENPTYEQVSSGKTYHAESVKVKYDSEQVSYQKLLDVFWSIHNPTTPNRQGADIGSNYRSIIFYYTPEQKKLALESKEALDKSGKFKNPIVTEILPAGKFWRAEEYHQKYYLKGGKGSCPV
jgi:peptide-methionine (S)-S-oxide reductase